MFGNVRRKSSNVRAMQLFHELKQQFPTLPDHVVSACIASHAHKTDKKDLRETLEVAAAQQDPMGRTLTETSEIALPTSPQSAEDHPHKEAVIEISSISPPPPLEPQQQQASEEKIPKPERRRRKKKLQTTPTAMDQKDQSENSSAIGSSVRYDKNTESVDASSDSNQTVKVGNSSFFVKRPNTLNLSGVPETNVSDRNFNNIQPSGRCSDVHKLLNSEIVNGKPPRSPLSVRKFNHKNSPTKGSPKSPSVETRSPSIEPETSSLLSSSKKTEPKTVETPTQTTDTLLGAPGGNGGTTPTTVSTAGGVNLSVNVNCSVDVVQSPTRSKCTTSLQLVPQQPWCHQEVVSPKSYTSVNLTLRPPSSEPQPPIDITSQNSCLTYSTSSFDPQKGLQSRLQITVGPSGGGVASMRTRPRSSYHPDNQIPDLVPSHRAGSLPDLTTDTGKIVIKEQQIRIDKLKIELRTEKVRLVAMQKDVADLERSENEAEKEKELQSEIKDLQEECKKLTIEVDNRCGSAALPLGETRAIFYDNIYTGQRPPLGLGFPTEHITTNHYRHRPFTQPYQPNPEIDGPKWNCHMCTFQNHPLLDRCEQCEMPRILHGKKQESPLQNRHPNNYRGAPNNNNTASSASSNSSNNSNNYPSTYHPDRPFHSQYSAPMYNPSSPSPRPYHNQFSCPGDLLRSPRQRRANGYLDGNLASPTRYYNQRQPMLYGNANSSNLSPVIPTQVYNPFGNNYNRNYVPNGPLNSSASSHGSS